MSLKRFYFQLFYFNFAGSLAGNNEQIFTNINFVDMEDLCVTATEAQIKKEILASMNYLSMAAFFSKDEINRPGFAKLFFGAASEEREHAYKLIEYLSMRGRYQLYKTGKSKKMDFDFKKIVGDFNDTKLYPGIVIEPLQKTYFKDDLTTKEVDRTSGLVALKNALKLETFVTKSIRGLIKECENEKKNGNNDYHVSCQKSIFFIS